MLAHLLREVQIQPDSLNLLSIGSKDSNKYLSLFDAVSSVLSLGDTINSEEGVLLVAVQGEGVVLVLSIVVL